MKIVHILMGSANPDTMIGPNKSIHWTATEQKRAGHDVEVWGIQPYASSTSIEHDHEYKLIYPRSTKYRFLLDQEIKEAIDRLNSDTWVQMHSVFIPEFWSIAKRLGRRNIQYGITPRGGYGSMAKSYFKKQLYITLFESFVVANANLVHAVGETEIGMIKQIAPSAKTLLVPNGYAIEYIKDFVPEPIESVRPVFGFCGRMDILHKGLDIMLDGFAIYKRNGGKGVLWLIGDGADRPALEQMAVRLGVDRQVTFYGTRYGNDKLQLIANMDFFIHTSRWEGTPNACMEAAALGTPLLVTRETNMGGYVENWVCGIVLRDSKDETVALSLKKCEELYISGEIKKMGVNAARMMKTDFRWAKIANKLADAWHSIIVKSHE